MTAELFAKGISQPLSTSGHCHNDAWSDEMVCADKRPSSFVFYSLYLFQGVTKTNTSPLVLKAHKSCFIKLVPFGFSQTKLETFIY